MAREGHNAKRSGKPGPPQPRASSADTGGDRAVRLIVGLGASAGGLDAFKAFLAHMPPDSGMGFVLIQHLDPHHKSLLVELLGKQTAMPVLQAEDGTAVAADYIYVIPPNAELTIHAGILHVTRPAPPREHRKPIDTFFTSLAEDQDEHAVCVILSGSGSDGSQGLKAIKEHGGFSLAQAGFDATALLGMPSSAASTGLVDEVLPVEQMPARLLAYAEHMNRVGPRKGGDGTREDAAEHLTRVCALLRGRLGHDFSQYKEKTLVRRIQRRMQVLQIDNVPDYIERLRQDPAQLDLLFHDLLIGVTQFFRDPEAFAALEQQVIPKLFENRRSDEPLRIWVPGCASGEEAYSIAILVREAMLERSLAPVVQIFATDLDPNAVAVARHGRYRSPIAGVEPERLQRWFTEEGDRSCVIKDVREMCIFPIHDLVRDPPFSRLDLISCRNLLIYLDTPLQNRLVRGFHYALRKSGYLFLGASEGIARHERLFNVLDKKYRLFQRRDDVAPAFPQMLPGAPPAHPEPAAAVSLQDGDGIDHRARQALLKYAPAYVVINRRHEVQRFSGHTGHYVEHAPGAASLDLFSIIRKDLLPAVRAAVQKGFAAQQTVVHEDLVIAINGHRRVVTLIVEPLPGQREPELYVVAFQDRGMTGGDSAPATTAEAKSNRVEALERELRATRAQLLATIDDLETANEELKSANEEYQSVNEEFQSANEELESSKEELQSMNEELHTINGELSAKNAALGEANSDVRNLLDSTQIATLFLGNDLRIRNYTPAIAEVFHLRAGDRGRPITEITTRLDYADLRQDVKHVLRSLAMIEREVPLAQNGGSFLMRIRPYRTMADVIDGVVISFIDITERRRHEEDRARLAAIVDSSQDAIIGHSLDGTITSWNAGAEKVFGYAATEAVGQPFAMLIPQHQADEVPRILQRLSRGERVEPYEIARTAKDDRKLDISMTISPVLSAAGAMIGASTVARDVTERAHAQHLRDLMMDELNHRVKNTLATVQSIAAQTLRGQFDPASREAFEGRLVALSRTHDLLALASWEGAPLRDVLWEELAPHQSDDATRCVIGGPDVMLSAKAALTLGMTFHELATNAAKHGALSEPGGQVRVSWETRRSSAPDVLHLTWAETGGPPVQRTGRKGFGTTLIERGVRHELEASVKVDFAPGGVVCTIELPLPAATGETRNDVN